MKIEKKKFNDIYNEINQESQTFFQELRQKQARILGAGIIFSIIVSMLIIILNEHDFFGFIPIAVAMILLAVVLSNSKFRKQYKDVIVGKLVSKYNPVFRYVQKGNIVYDREIYDAGFDRDWDEVVKEDGITGRLEDGSDFRLVQITTYKYKYYLDNEENRQKEKEKMYKGTFCVIDLAKTIMNQIEITGDARKQKYNKDRVEIDSAGFEAKFDLIAKDRVHAMRIFTPEVIEQFVKLRERIKSNYRVRIEGDKIYIKIDNGDIFEPITYKAEISASALLEYYNTLDIPVTIATMIIRGAADL